MALRKINMVSWRPQGDGSKRPRFNPGPRERALGFVGHDLKTAAGAWMTYEQVELWWFGADGSSGKCGEILAARAGGKAIKLPAPTAHRTAGDLVEDFLTHPKTKRKLAAGTIYNYRMKQHALMFKPCADFRKKSWAEREREPFSLAPMASITAGKVDKFFEYLVRERGLAMANKVILLFSAACTWGMKDDRWQLPANPCLRLGMDRPKPRVKVWQPDDVEAFCAGADRCGEPELGDAVIVGLFSGQRQRDVLNFAGAGLDDGVLTLQQLKTGTLVEVPVVPPLARRLVSIERRREASGSRARELVVDGRTGEAFKSNTFQSRFRDMTRLLAKGDRALGLKPRPELLELNFQDLRDTCLTWLSWSGNDDRTIAGVSGHSPKTVTATLAHYIAPMRGEAKRAMKKLAAWIEEEGISTTLGAPKLLPAPSKRA